MRKKRNDKLKNIFNPQLSIINGIIQVFQSEYIEWEIENKRKSFS